MTASDTIRIRVDPAFKERVTSMYAQRGTTVSAAVRSFLADELASHSSASEALEAIFASADRKIEASGMPEPTIEEINDYIARVRSERAADSLAAS